MNLTCEWGFEWQANDVQFKFGIAKKPAIASYDELGRYVPLDVTRKGRFDKLFELKAQSPGHLLLCRLCTERLYHRQLYPGASTIFSWIFILSRRNASKLLERRVRHRGRADPKVRRGGL